MKNKFLLMLMLLGATVFFMPASSKAQGEGVKDTITMTTGLTIGTILTSDEFSVNEDSGSKKYTITGLETLKGGKHKVISQEIMIEGELYEINCSSMKLSAFNVEKAPRLNSIDCRDNNLTEVNFSNNAKVTYLACGQNPLTSIDVSAMPMLKFFNCQGSAIATLSLENNKVLRSLYAHNCSNLSTVTFHAESNLEVAYLFKNKLTRLDVSTCKKLETLRCEENLLTALDLSVNDNLIGVDCSLNQLTSLKGATNAETSYKLFGNQIKAAAMEAFIKGLPETERELQLYVIDTSLGEREGNVCTTKAVDMALDKGYKVKDFNGSDEKDYAGSEVPNVPTITMTTGLAVGTVLTSDEFSVNEDSGSKKYTIMGLEALKGGKHKVLSQDITIEGELYEINCSSMKLSALNVEKATELKSIDCRDNNLAELNLSNNAKVTYLACGQNPLTSIDVSAMPMLKFFNCQGSAIATLSLENNKVLRSLYAHNCPNLSTVTFHAASNLEVAYLFKNKLTQLDVSTCKKLETLRCEENLLTALDLSMNNNLIGVDCSLNQLTSLKGATNAQASYKLFGNQIKEAAMDAFINGLPETEQGLLLYVIDTSLGEREGNECNTKAVEMALDKGYKVKDFNGSDEKDYAGSVASSIASTANEAQSWYYDSKQGEIFVERAAPNTNVSVFTIKGERVFAAKCDAQGKAKISVSEAINKYKVLIVTVGNNSCKIGL